MDYESVDGSARAGTDYRAVSGTLRLGAGETVGVIRIPLIHDPAREPTESFRVMLLNPPAGIPLGLRTNQVTILDDANGVWHELSVPAEPETGLQRENGLNLLTWVSEGRPQRADRVDGPWSDLTGAESPYASRPVAAAGFYRIQPPRPTQVFVPSSYDGSREVGFVAYEGCTALGLVILPTTVTQVDYLAFSQCRGLTQVSLPDSLSALGWGVFVGCERLVDVKLPSHLPGIPDRAFEGCAALTRIHLPETLGGISNRAFADCVGLDTILIPRTVIHLAPDAFSGCRSLTEIRVAPGNRIFNARDGFVTDLKGWTLLIFPPGRTGDQIVPDGHPASRGAHGPCRIGVLGLRQLGAGPPAGESEEGWGLGLFRLRRHP